MMTLSARAADAPKADPIHVLTIDLAGQMREDTGAGNKMESKTQIRFRTISRGEFFAMYQVSTFYRNKMDGALLEEDIADKEKLIHKKPNHTDQLVISSAAEKFRDEYTATFEQPLCALTLDADGKVEKVTMPDSLIAKSAETRDLAGNLQYFYPMFPLARAAWEQPRELTVGQDHLTGTLKYEKRAASEKTPMLIPVAVTGTLTSMLTGNNGDTLTLTYTVTGEQTYDREARQWISGKHDLTFTSVAGAANKIHGEYKGTLTVTLDDEKPKEPEKK